MNITFNPFFGHLEKTYGKPVDILRETPFTLVLDKEHYAGYKVADRLICYPVQGRIIRIK